MAETAHQGYDFAIGALRGHACFIFVCVLSFHNLYCRYNKNFMLR